MRYLFCIVLLYGCADAQPRVQNGLDALKKAFVALCIPTPVEGADKQCKDAAKLLEAIDADAGS